MTQAATVIQANTVLDSAIPVPEKVTKLLQPIQGGLPAGMDVSGIEEYIKLEMEVAKPKPDYNVWTEWSSHLLMNKSKNVRVALWLCFGWYRTQGMEGLRNGLVLVLELIKQFGDQLQRQNTRAQAKSFGFLNTRLPRFLEKQEVHTGNAEDAGHVHTLFNQIKCECQKVFQDHAPVMKELEQAIASCAAKAKKFLDSNAPTREQQVEKKPDPLAKQDPAILPKPTAPVQAVSVRSEKDARITIKNSLWFFFESEQDGKKERKVAQEAYVYGMSRALRWHNLQMPPHKESVTQIQGPNTTRRNYIHNLFINQDWDTLIPVVEIEFLNLDGFQYWMDGQRYVVHALEQKAGPYHAAAMEIKMHFARLIQRLPDLAKLKFKDKQTPFAASETICWIDNEVRPVLGSGKSTGTSLLPPVMGEEYYAIASEYERACAQLPENFDQNAQAMQAAIQGDTRQKGRFLRLLNLANYCFAAKRYETARALLHQLTDKIQAYQLAEWEPGLCTAVWQTVYLTNAKLLQNNGSDSQAETLQKEQKQLFDRIVNLDCVRAMKLLDCSHNSKKGE